MKKGFTLVELIAVIFILGVIMTIAVVAVDKTIKDNKEQLYEIQISNIEDAARTWGNAHITLLPDENGGAISIPLLLLKQDGLLDNDFKNPKTEELFPNNMYIDISYENGVYNYNVAEESGTKDTVEIDYPAIIFKEKWKLNHYYVSFDGWVILSDKSIVASPEVDMLNDTENQMSIISFTDGTKKFIASRKVNASCNIIDDQDEDGYADFGDQIGCGTEKFYVINNDGNNIEMLTKYRINLTSKMQNKDVEEVDNVAFSSTEYWKTDESIDLDKYPMTYQYVENGWPTSSTYPQNHINRTTYIFDKEQAVDQNSVTYYVVEYEKKLKEMGLTIAQSKLMSYEQALTLGCVQYDYESKTSHYTCGPGWVDETGQQMVALGTYAPAWVWNVSYWLGSHTINQNGKDRLWTIDIDGSFDREEYNQGNYHGVRPVVTIPSSYLVEN